MRASSRASASSAAWALRKIRTTFSIAFILTVSGRAQFLALAANAFFARLREALNPVEDRLRIQMCFGNHLCFQTACQPLVVPVRSQGIIVRQRPEAANRPDAPRARPHHHR